MFNRETLSYDEAGVSLRTIALKAGGLLLSGFLCFLLYGYLYTAVLGLKLPKMIYLERENARLVSRFEILEEHLDEQEHVLAGIGMRDNAVYRPIFGMEQTQPFAGESSHGGAPALVRGRVDALSMRTVVQSKSFDEVEMLARRAGDMAACIPNISPIDMHDARVGISSPFGYRIHPIYNRVSHHHGIDLRGPVGLPVYATADGVVKMAEKNFMGYGNCVMIDHGFGYKTRYAHLQKMLVAEGQKVSRGDRIATLGRSGRSTGAHLHYEVIFHDHPVNPWNYLDNLSVEEYRGIVHSK